MSYSAAPYAKIIAGTDRDSEHNYQCSNYRNRYHQCFNHYIKASDLEAAILKAVQAVSEHVLENEDGFVDQLMEQWNLKQQQSSADDKKELAEIEHYLRHFCTYFDYELDELMRSPFTVAMPDSNNPYRQMYVPN